MGINEMACQSLVSWFELLWSWEVYKTLIQFSKFSNKMTASTTVGNQEKIVSPLNNGLISLMDLFTKRWPTNSDRPPGALEALKGGKHGTVVQNGEIIYKRFTLTFQISVIDRSYTNTATNGTNENISPPEDHKSMIDTFEAMKLWLSQNFPFYANTYATSRESNIELLMLVSDFVVNSRLKNAMEFLWNS